MQSSTQSSEPHQLGLFLLFSAERLMPNTMLEQPTTRTVLAGRDSDVMAGIRQSAVTLFCVAVPTTVVFLPSDVAIGAPKEDDFSGAVYIYHGDAGGIVPQYSMVTGVRVTWSLFAHTFI